MQPGSAPGFQKPGLLIYRLLERIYCGSLLHSESSPSCCNFERRFHAIYLPAVLQALDLPLQRRLLTHAHWTVEQKKMSKSIGNVVDPFEIMQEFGVDAVRFYLARVGGKFRDDVGTSPHPYILRFYTYSHDQTGRKAKLKNITKRSSHCLAISSSASPRRKSRCVWREHRIVLSKKYMRIKDHLH